VLVLVGLGCAVLVAALGDHGSTAQVAPTGPPPTPGAPPGGAVFVHVLGAVQRPGLYELREGARAVDAVAAAGGFLESADQAQVNLARFVTDGEQLVVPEQGVAPPPGAAAAAPGLLNLNTADASALEALPGIGPALAARIVDWRDANGRFTAVDDLQQVSGIGDKTFAELKDLVTV
jgi:competence protein ComEA